MKRTTATALLLSASLTASCGPTAGDLERADTGPSAEPEEPAKAPYTIAFGGDVHFEGALRERLDASPDTALGPIASRLSEADLAMVNLETAVTGGGTPAPGKQFRFRAPATAFDALDSAGVDAATVANNHGMDFGPDGLEDTLANAEAAGFPLVGAGRDEDGAYAPHTVELGGDTIALLGATDVLDAHLMEQWTARGDRPGLASAKNDMQDRLVRAVSDAAETADAVVVYLHWGLEGDHCPLPHAPELAQRLLDAGADAVVGGHAHVLSPGGYAPGGYVHYGLGNFVFYNHNGPTAQSGVLTLTLQDGEVIGDEWAPARLEGGVPVPYEGEAAETATAQWEELRTTCMVGLSAVASG
ncbi:CapA family protein [Nocardiopsis chromatogenes]|uniref:CapA family protein n=1 Tax=Nocardiopsis chromatogenes TaxID=280239 RepID=UPI0003452A9B|nr:CapA family protein [Nocardiopsis chromatogenes]